MSIFDDKVLKSVADAAAKIMSEELKGNQHKIDANKNQKIDAHDFKILRGEKPPFEGGKEKPETVTDKSGAKHGPMSKARDLARRALKKEEVEQIDESVWDWKSSGTPKKTGETTRTGHDIRKTSTGTVYTKRAQEEKPEDAAPKSRKKQKLGSSSDLMSDEEFKKKHGMSRKNYERMQSGVKIGESFSEILEAYQQHGLAVLPAISVLEEEPTEEEFNAELEKAKAKAEGKGPKADVHAAGVKAVKIAEEDLSDFSLEELEDFMMSEEFEQLDELSKSTLQSYMKKAEDDASRLDQKAKSHPRKIRTGEDARKLDNRRIGIVDARMRLRKMKEEVEQIEEGSSTSRKPWRDINSPEYRELSQNVRRRSEQENAAKPGKELLKKIEKKNMKEEVELDERHLTEPEMKKREEYAKGMKKKLSDFKERYGKRAKEVMYATATKMAKGDKE